MITANDAKILTQKAKMDAAKKATETLTKFKEEHAEEIKQSLEQVESEIQKACSKQRTHICLPTGLEFTIARNSDLKKEDIIKTFYYPWCNYNNSNDVNIQLYNIVRDELIANGFKVTNLRSARVNGTSEIISWRELECEN